MVLGYINNGVKGFKKFVANCVQLNRDLENVMKWNYVNSAENPSDYAQRDLDIFQKEKVHKWFQGPQFLWDNESTWCMHNTDLEVNNEDSEVKKQVTINMTQYNEDLLSRLLD